MTIEQEPDTISLVPNWERMLLWMCEAQAQHAFNKDSYGVMASVLESTRFLAATNPDALNRIIDKLKEKGDM